MKTKSRWNYPVKELWIETKLRSNYTVKELQMETKTIFILILLLITTLSWPNFDWFTMFSLFFNSGPPAVCVVVKENIDLPLLSERAQASSIQRPGFFHRATKALSSTPALRRTCHGSVIIWTLTPGPQDKDSSYSSLFAYPAISFWSPKSPTRSRQDKDGDWEWLQGHI